MRSGIDAELRFSFQRDKPRIIGPVKLVLGRSF